MVKFEASFDDDDCETGDLVSIPEDENDTKFYLAEFFRQRPSIYAVAVQVLTQWACALVAAYACACEYTVHAAFRVAHDIVGTALYAHFRMWIIVWPVATLEQFKDESVYVFAFEDVRPSKQLCRHTEADEYEMKRRLRGVVFSSPWSLYPTLSGCATELNDRAANVVSTCVLYTKIAIAAGVAVVSRHIPSAKTLTTIVVVLTFLAPGVFYPAPEERFIPFKFDPAKGPITILEFRGGWWHSVTPYQHELMANYCETVKTAYGQQSLGSFHESVHALGLPACEPVVLEQMFGTPVGWDWLRPPVRAPRNCVAWELRKGVLRITPGLDCQR